MTLRAIVLGIGLGLFVATTTYFNDNVMRQTQMIGNHLPASVFGVAMLLLLVVNPALRGVAELAGRLAGRSADAVIAWGDRIMLKPAEIAVILAMGLAVCAWPGSNLLRIFTQLMVAPAYRLPVQSAWQANAVMAYVPGQSAQIPIGHVRDLAALAGALRDPADGSPAAAIADRLPAEAREALQSSATGPLTDAQRDALLEGLNAVIAGPPLPGADPADDDALAVRNRHVLDSVLPGLRPLAIGTGVLLQAEGRGDDAITPLMTGGVGRPVSVAEVPWDVWWPTLRTWGGALLCAALATLCLIMVVHPQWAHRELLRYPTAEFVHEVTRWSPGRYLPAVASSKMFWLGFVPIVAIHLLNGLHSYFEQLPWILRELPLEPLKQLFPDAARAHGANRVFRPLIFPCVIGFGYFVTTRVSMSVGLSLLFWVALGALHLKFGLQLNDNRVDFSASGPALRFGAYIAMSVMIIYYGRAYYADVVRGAFGRPIASTTPRITVWAARLAALFAAMSIYCLVAYVNMTPLMATLFVGVFLMMLVVLARINAETGLFYAQPDWLPGVALAGIFGAYGLGAEGTIAILLASQVFAADPREGLSPYIANALRFGDRVRTAYGKPAAALQRLAPLLAGMIALGLVVAVVTTLWVQYNRGVNTNDGWARNLPVNTFNQATTTLAEFDARGQLSEIGRLTGLEQLTHMRPEPTFVRYTALGFVLLLGCAIARTRLPWWPIHPVLFLVWGTYPANYMAFSFLLAGIVKWSVVRIGGAKAYNDTKPLMVGLIVADLLMIIAWSIVGAAYYFNTGLTPPTYRILPI